MVYPSLRDWLFSVKTFTAAMLALYIGLKAELLRPYWAMASVHIVSNPFVGATRSKALYRVPGAALGAAAATGSLISGRQLRDALHALVGLRLSLFPAGIAPPSISAGESAA
jgi:uncharacterized membrane protein YccC